MHGHWNYELILRSIDNFKNHNKHIIWNMYFIDIIIEKLINWASFNNEQYGLDEMSFECWPIMGNESNLIKTRSI